MCYTVPSGTGLVQVCARTFKEIFGLTNRKLQTLNTKKKQGCDAFTDERGTKTSSHSHKFKYNENDNQLVREHVMSFPMEESH
jgi:hypothetical protein